MIITIPGTIITIISERPSRSFRNRHHHAPESTRIEREPIEKCELERLLGQYGVPGDFDVAQLNWQPSYDPSFYKQLAKRARRLYLFREEYILDLVAGVAVETPQSGHATYLFAQPVHMETFLALYARVTKDDIRANRDNVAERLGFLWTNCARR
jgi:hypothetical protein